MIDWRIHHKAETTSTNLDAREGHHGDVFTADFQTAGRGRLDHTWLSPPGENLTMSVVLSVGGLTPEQVSTLPLVAGLAVAKAVKGFLGKASGGQHRAQDVGLKWPNDVVVGGRKIAGVLCERLGDLVIVGIGVNVRQVSFDRNIAENATSLAILTHVGGACPHNGGSCPRVVEVREAILAEMERQYACWLAKGFAVVYPEIAAVDILKGRVVSVRQVDDDSAPLVGLSDGIMPEGSLSVGGEKVYAGEAHVENLA